MKTKKKWTKKELNLAHLRSANNRPGLQKDNRCGCFCCLRIFDPAEIKNWIIDPQSPIDNLGTAVCPYCSCDSVIGESSGFPVDEDFLDAMNARYFAVSRLLRTGKLSPALLEQLINTNPPPEEE